MSGDCTGLRVLVWLTVPLVALALCAFAGAVVGSMIGGALGHPEGEGFIGFLYGLYGGAAAGALLGAFAAWRIDHGLRAAG